MSNINAVSVYQWLTYTTLNSRTDLKMKKKALHTQRQSWSLLEKFEGPTHDILYTNEGACLKYIESLFWFKICSSETLSFGIAVSFFKTGLWTTQEKSMLCIITEMFDKRDIKSVTSFSKYYV